MRWKISGVALLSAAALAAVLIGREQLRQRAELDELNPFGSVQDEQLPSQLGQPPVLSAMLHTDYPPGFNRDGQPVGSGGGEGARQSSQQGLSYVGVASAGPSPGPAYLNTGGLPPAQHAVWPAPGPRGRGSSRAPRGSIADAAWSAASPAANRWRQYRAGAYPLYTSNVPPPPDFMPTPQGAFGGGASVGATKTERDYWTQAQGSYWRALDHFYKAEDAATNADWVARRFGWASNSPEASAHAAVGDAILNKASAMYNEGKQVKSQQLAGATSPTEERRAAGHVDLERQHQSKAAERDYMQALVYLDKATKAGGGKTSADEWGQAQRHWDYFYQTSRVLDGKQQRLDAKRAQILRQFLPRSEASGAVKIDAFTAPWQPFPACFAKSEALTRARSSRALRALKRLTTLHARKHGARKDAAWDTDLKAVCYAARALSAARSPVAFTSLASTEGEQLHHQAQRVAGSRGRDAGATRAGNEQAKVQKELDGAMAPLNDEQARLNRARMILYVKQFGPMRALFSARPPANKASLWFPGDFEQPRNDDCDTPGACHDWADGAYIDSFAAATTNWDSMGQPTPGYLHWDTMADDGWEGPADTVRDGGNPNVRWSSTHTQELLQIPTVADDSFDWKGFNEQQLKLQQRALHAAQVLMSPTVQDFGPAQLFGRNAAYDKGGGPAQSRTTGLQVSGKGGWFETHAPSGSPLPTSASGMLGVDEQWRPPPGLPFGGNIASRPLAAGARMADVQEQRHEAEVAEESRLKAKLHKVQNLMNQQWTGVPRAAGGQGTKRDAISDELLDDLNAPLRQREQRQQAEAAARAANDAAQQALGEKFRQYGDVEDMQKPVLNARFRRQVEQADDAIDAALHSKIVSHSDDPAARGQRGTVSAAPSISRWLSRGEASHAAGPPDAHDSYGASEYLRGPVGEEGELSEVIRLKARLRRQRDANRRLEKKLSQAQQQGFGKKYGAQLQQTEQRVAEAVAKRLSPQVLKQAALEVAHKVTERQARAGRSGARGQSLARENSKGYESIARECDGAHEWSAECAEARKQNTGPQPMRMAGSDRFHDDGVHMKNIREGDDQDVNYRFPRGAAYPNRDGTKPMNSEKASKDADDADKNAKAAWAAAYSRHVRQGGGGDEDKGEEVADDAPRYRWVHHRNQVFRTGASQNWAREHGSELPEEQQKRADEFDEAHKHDRDYLHISQVTGGEPMWGRRRGDIKHGSMRGAYYDYSGRDKWPFARPASDHWKYARRRAERAAVGAQKVEAAKVFPADDNYDEATAKHAKFCHDSPEKCVPGGMTGEDSEMRRRRTRDGIARDLYKEHSEGKSGGTGEWHTSGTEEEQQRRNAHEPLTRGRDPLEMQNSTLDEGELGTEAGDGEVVVSDDEPWEISGDMSSTYHGQKHWQPHYFNHAFWSQLYHYFKGDKPSEYCNVCVGEFMTALQDISDPETGVQRHARASQIPAMCQGVCESNQALGYKFHRQVPTAGQAEATMKRANLLQHVAETEDEREETYQREYKAFVHSPPKEADYRVTRMEPTAEGAEHAGVLREARDLSDRSRAVYGDAGYAETNGGLRRFRTQSTRQIHDKWRREPHGRAARQSGDDMPVSAAVKFDLQHMGASAADAAAATAAVAAAKAVRTPPASVARQANSQEADGADAAYSPGGAMHPHRAQASAAAALAAAEQDRKQHQKIERDRVIMGAKAATQDLAQMPAPVSSVATALAARQANELQAGGYN